MVSDKDAPVLFYDGDCGLCSRSVRFLMRQDRSRLLYFAPLQGETASHRLETDLHQSLTTVVYQRADGETFIRSDAVLRALIDTGSAWRFFAHPALLIPRSWRDGIYNWIAANRRKILSKDSCPLPSPEENRQLLP
ncbi:thiol-disulfide oxidoreductase [Coraliomargarita sinensis]|uniref:Thiol-disulfide oxidoreductase n=1 Tax=Coraliomargarita sinensis TaxID=2174842 RepID=A0A317ZKH5_9BACT|nr:DCC1-like thiol-disulfide oxidoreductase family protein [Coraliomargarita sinensis]PXA04687.1 thiol-disulfide oxidoreductase [Coraliomargarita sinensis]